MDIIIEKVNSLLKTMDAKPILLLSVLAVIFILESIYPHMQGRTQRVRHAIPHVATAVLNGVLTRLLLAGITMKTIAWAEGESLGIARVTGLSAPLRMLLVFVLFDLWMFYWHMANHRIAFLWRFHRAHHADIEMDATTALRFHPGELLLSTFLRLPAVVLIGMSFSELVVFETMLNSSTLFHHSNLAVPEKWDRVLRSIIVTPNMHRVHHSIEREETDSNFTSVLSVWDRLARTFRMRQDTRAIVFGLPAFREARYQGFRGFLITPFR